MAATGTWNSWPWNALPWNGAAARSAVSVLAPLSIDQRSFAANWDDDRTIRLETYAMTKTDVQIKNVVRGDAKRIKRTYTGLPSGYTVAKAYLTIKASLDDADGDALAQRSITTSATTSGQITDATTTDGQIAMHFDLSEANTLAASAQAYYYDVQVELNSGESHTLEVGTIQFIKGVTGAQS